MLGMITEDDDGEAAKMPMKSTNGRTNSNSGSNARNQQRNNGKRPVQPAAEPDYYPDEPAYDDPALPQLDGVSYQYTTTQDGRQCIIATGNTHPKKEILRGAGFSWDAAHKCWWKYANVS